MSSEKKEPVKVVIINTQYIETDAVSFKTVVQRLTGKDSTIEDEPSSSSLISKAKASRARAGAVVKLGTAAASCNNNNLVWSRNVSFKDFDGLVKELPPFEELIRLCND